MINYHTLIIGENISTYEKGSDFEQGFTVKSISSKGSNNTLHKYKEEVSGLLYHKFKYWSNIHEKV